MCAVRLQLVDDSIRGAEHVHWPGRLDPSIRACSSARASDSFARVRQIHISCSTVRPPWLCSHGGFVTACTHSNKTLIAQAPLPRHPWGHAIECEPSDVIASNNGALPLERKTDLSISPAGAIISFFALTKSSGTRTDGNVVIALASA